MSTAQSKGLPQRIGRFKVKQALAKGGQGVALLAVDEELSREVAIKLLRPAAVATDRDQFVREARIVAGFRHPNIVTLHEMGVHHSLPYLVFEYIDGKTLADVLAENGAFCASKAVVWMSQILAGVAYAHQNNIVHRDLNPANIFITSDGIPKVADFGIATSSGRTHSPSEDVWGTLRYMSPEPFRNTGVGPHSDVFALGAIFFEMLVGRAMIQGDNKALMVDTIVNGEVELPSAYRDDIHRRVDGVIAKALQREVSARYPTAREMKSDLDLYRIPREGSGDSADHSTVEFLLRRISHKKGFSALSNNITEVLKLTSEESGVSAERMANVLAKDVTLTQRVLTAANSALYGAKNITTVSRAIVLLGLKQVRMLVTSAMIEVQFDSGAPELSEALIMSFFSAVFGKEVARASGSRQADDVFTCSIFHDLGRTLTIHYFAEEFQVICERVAEGEETELTVARQILGIPYHEIGMGVARAWKFPETIIEAMVPLPRADVTMPHSESESLQRYAAFANAAAHAIADRPGENLGLALEELVSRMEPVFTLADQSLDRAFSGSEKLTRKYVGVTRMDEKASAYLKKLSMFNFTRSNVAGDSSPSERSTSDCDRFTKSPPAMVGT